MSNQLTIHAIPFVNINFIKTHPYKYIVLQCAKSCFKGTTPPPRMSHFVKMSKLAWCSNHGNTWVILFLFGNILFKYLKNTI